MRAPTTVTIPAPAKINLLLYVLDRQSTGYHSIVSLMQTVDLCDRLALTLRPIRHGIRLLTRSQILPLGRDNLITRAARAFMKRYRLESGLRIELVKNIPIGAGLGGGSSDAAATLHGLFRLHRMAPRHSEIVALGRGLGSDVPFFFAGPTAWVSGTGDRIDPISLGEHPWAVLANPGFEVSTAWVYSELDRYRADASPRPRTFLQKLGLTLDGNRHKITTRASKAFPLTKRSFPLHNDLEVITIGRYPVIETMKERLCSLGAKEALMAGSGPTVFGLFPDRSSAHTAARILRNDSAIGWGPRQGGWRFWVTRLMSRRPW